MAHLPSTFHIGSTAIGAGHPCFLIAEIAQAHDGSLGTAHAYIDAVAGSGRSAVKFQTHIAAAESTPAEPFRVKFSAAGRHALRLLEADGVQRAAMARPGRSCRASAVWSSSRRPFRSPPWSLLDRLGMAAWKVGSGEDRPTCPCSRGWPKPAGPYCSPAGMASWDDLDAAHRLRRRARRTPGGSAMHDGISLPVGKNWLNVMAKNCASATAVPSGCRTIRAAIYAGLAAVTLGANVIEVHVILSRECFGPDVPASLTTDELASTGRGSAIHRAHAGPSPRQGSASPPD